MAETEYPVTFEWQLRDLKSIYEASEGAQKSQVVKSDVFGNGRWQILFYANAGLGTSDDLTSGHISLFLACEPTDEEKEAVVASDGQWVREGKYNFSFEIHDLHKKDLLVRKEAHKHSFLSKTANWGWAQLAKRDVVFYNRPSIREQDALIITCTVTRSPEEAHTSA
ncbi:hypothetical protein PENSPDRAFT_313183 [Peniophora sp. CONT]|nr:hypothetical protein PENSPDRAFT_313183 [Peniophora sp. CONT]